MQKNILKIFVLITLLFFTACDTDDILPIEHPPTVKPTALSRREIGRTGEYVEFACSSFPAGHTHTLPMYGTLIFDVDFIERYEDTLNSMFCHEWTYTKSEIYQEFDPDSFDGLCHRIYEYRISPYQFFQWSIEYYDGNGDKRNFVFHNRISFSTQVENYVTRLVRDYYKENFFDVHMYDESTLNFFAGFIIRANVNRGDIENQEWVRSTDEYRRLLATPEGAISLTKLKPANVFEMIPFYLSVRIIFNEHPNAEQNVFAENIIKELNYFANNRLNASIIIGCYHRFRYSYRFHYIQGERIFLNDRRWSFFNRCLFESYIGVFW